MRGKQNFNWNFVWFPFADFEPSRELRIESRPGLIHKTEINDDYDDDTMSTNPRIAPF